MEQNLEPIELEFDLSSFAGIQKFHEALAQLVLEKRLGAGDFAALNGMIANQIRMLMPGEVEAKIDELLQQTQDLRQALDRVKRSRGSAK